MNDVVRVVDRTEEPDAGSRRSRSPSTNQPGRPSIHERFAYYWSGPGWQAAFDEARRLVSAGVDFKTASRAVGWTEADLAMAMRGGRPEPSSPPCECVVAERPCVCTDRPTGVVCRGPGPRRSTEADLEIARQGKLMYEKWRLSVPEVARALSKSRSRTYAMLEKVGTEFRRRGRRDDGDLAIAKEHARVKFPPRPAQGQEKSVRTVPKPVAQEPKVARPARTARAAQEPKARRVVQRKSEPRQRLADTASRRAAVALPKDMLAALARAGLSTPASSGRRRGRA